MNLEETKEEIKKKWIFYLTYGIIIIIVSTILQTYVQYWTTEKIQGPSCRIDFPVEKFNVKNSTNFKIEYLFINLRDKDLLIEGIDAYCYWKSEEEFSEQTGIIIGPPSIEQVSAPKELEKFPASKSAVKTAFCRSPYQEGTYKIRIIARTTLGTCEGNILMEVIEK